MNSILQFFNVGKYFNTIIKPYDYPLLRWMWQILPPKDIEGQETAIYVKMVMKGLRDSEKTSEKKNEYRWAAKTLPIKGTARQKSSHQEMNMEWLRWEFYKTVSRHWKMWNTVFNNFTH